MQPRDYVGPGEPTRAVSSGVLRGVVLIGPVDLREEAEEHIGAHAIVDADVQETDVTAARLVVDMRPFALHPDIETECRCVVGITETVLAERHHAQTLVRLFGPQADA